MKLETMFFSETLVTDTYCWELVKCTPKTMTLRRMMRGEKVYSNNEYLPVVGYEALRNPKGETITVRLRKDGTYRRHRSSNPLRHTMQPIFYVDYKF